MATEAAWLTGNRLTERRKKKCALTSIGLLMEGLRVLLSGVGLSFLSLHLDRLQIGIRPNPPTPGEASRVLKESGKPEKPADNDTLSIFRIVCSHITVEFPTPDKSGNRPLEPKLNISANGVYRASPGWTWTTLRVFRGQGTIANASISVAMVFQSLPSGRCNGAFTRRLPRQCSTIRNSPDNNPETASTYLSTCSGFEHGNQNH